jgi:hypothetical protein
MPAPWETDFSKNKKEEDIAPWERSYGPTPSKTSEKAPTAPTTLRDIGVAGASGVVGATKALTDVFGADNAASRALGSASAGLQEMYTPERQREMQYYQAKQEEAAKKGDITGEIGAAFEGIKAAPLQGTVQAIGSLVPNLATLFIPGAGQARALQISRGAVNTAIGIMQGTGAVKGAIYEGVKQELIKNGTDESTAERMATQAQSYLGPNADQILAGAVIGYGAGKLGAEEFLTPGARAATRKLATIGTEMGTEAIQGGQEQVAQNLALQRQGFDVPTFQGVAGAATQEGILGALGAGPVSLMAGRQQTPPTPPEAQQTTEAAASEAQQEAKPPEPPAPPAPPERPPMPTDAGLSYGTATQEVELLKNQPRTPETEARIKELQQYKMETLSDQISASRLPVSDDLKAIRAQMERGDMTYEGQQRAIDQLLAEFYSSRKGFKGVEKETLPKTEEEQELADLNKDARALSAEYKAVTAKKLNTELKRALAGKLFPDEVVSEIGIEREYKYLAAPKGARGKLIADLVNDGALDEFLPPNMRAEAAGFDGQESEEYIKDLLRTEQFRPYDAQIQARILGDQLGEIDNRIKELTELPKRMAELSPEEVQAETDRLAREAGYLGQPRAEEVITAPEAQQEAATEAQPATVATPSMEQYERANAEFEQLAQMYRSLNQQLQNTPPETPGVENLQTQTDSVLQDALAAKANRDAALDALLNQRQPDVLLPEAGGALATTQQQAAPNVPFPERPAQMPEMPAAAQAAGVPAVAGQAAPQAPAQLGGPTPSTAPTTETPDIIDGQMRVIDEETIAPVVAQLAAPEQQTLADHYGEEVNSPAFLQKLREDIVNFTTKGAQSVAAAIRNIIRKLQASILAAAVILNPNYIGPGYQVAIPQNVTTVEQVLAKVPESVKARMSPGAQQAYANIMPAIQAELQKSNKLFVLTDKPNARLFVFDSNGQPILDKKVLLGLQTGDYYKGDTEIKANRFTPAGLFTMGLRDAKRGITETGGNETKTAGEYDFGKVFVLDKAAPDGSYSVTLFHSVWTKESDARSRLNALAKDSPEDSRYSFGCINVDKDSYKFLLDNYEKQMDGAKLFIVPDNPNATMDFVRGKAVTAGDLSRQAAPEVTRTVTKTVPGTPSAAAAKTQMAARKEEDRETREPGKYMQAKPNEKGMTKAAVDRAVDAIKSTWKNAPDIEVVQNISELPAEIQEDIARDKVNPRGVYDPTTKKVFLVADNIPNNAQAAITLAHESLGHFGLRVVLGTNFKPMMSQIYEGNKNVRERADAYMEEGLDRETAVEEVLSEMAQEVYDTSVPESKLRPTRTALQKIMNAVRQFLARIGVPIKTIDDAAVLALIANARRSVVRGEGVAGEMAGGKSLYSARERMERVAKRMSSKRPEMERDAFDGVDEGFVSKLGDVFFPENKTIFDRIDGMRDNFFQKLAQGVADQYRTIKDYTPEGYMLARMSKTIDGALEGLLFNGQVTLTDGALDIKQGTQGLFKVMEPVGKEVDRFQIWMALNRDAQLVRQGKAPSVDPKLVARVSELEKGKIGNKSRLEVYEQVRRDMNALNKSVLNIARKQGLIDDAAYEIFSNDINYIPFYKAMEDGDVQGAATASGLARQEFSKQLKGGEKPFGDLMENTLRNWSHILSASMKNKAANVTVDAAMDMGAAYPNLKVGLEWRDGKVYSTKSGEMAGDGKLKAEYTTQKAGMVKTMIDGKPAYFEIVDPLLLESISSIGYMGPKSKFLDVAKDFKNILQFGVTLSPAFKVRNLFRDSISAMAVSDLKRSPFANVVNGWKASATDNPAHISALAGGAIFNFGSAYEGDQSRMIKRLLKQGVSRDSILDTDEKIKKGIADAWRKYQEWGNKSESANRMALYQQMRDRGMSHLEASFYARDLLDFSMQGSWPAFRLVAQTVPFLNARVQGLYKLGRDGIVPTGRVIYNTATGKPIEATDKQKAQQFSTVTGAVVLASMALYLMFKDDDEFKKREAWDRDNFWWFKLPGMETALRVPKPFEIGAFGTMSERVLEQIIDQGAEGKQFEESFRRMLGDTFALNPTPQVIKPLLDLYANKDSFTGAPIETAGMERLSKQERASDSTSPIAIALGGISNILSKVTGEKTELSPVQIDYAIKSYLGWLGGTISSTSHYAVMPFSKSAYPDHNWTDTMSLGFVKSLPATQSRYVTEFYQNSKQISQAYADMRHYAELGETDKVNKILEEKGDQIALAKSYDKAAKDMSRVRQAISAIRADETMSGAEKKEEIDRLKLLIGEIAQQMEDVRRDLKN